MHKWHKLYCNKKICKGGKIMHEQHDQKQSKVTSGGDTVIGRVFLDSTCISIRHSTAGCNPVFQSISASLNVKGVSKIYATEFTNGEASILRV
mmetsp:Transcript_14323/g.20979  ORF Transcript_14323/g.20979 Transcript_14323/m.20979 type:complete len:93 (-) Transcript_14323:86-364(-)